VSGDIEGYDYSIPVCQFMDENSFRRWLVAGMAAVTDPVQR
jgi:hypothetical protein